MHLIIACDPAMPDDIKQKYIDSISSHQCHSDSGFDLFCPDDTTTCSTKVFINFQIKAVLLYGNMPKAYYLYPRSSISKTPFRMANSVGIIDLEYRGFLGAYVDVLVNDSILEKGVRLFQICSPNLEPFTTDIIPMDQFMELYGDTQRGECGFGSTGV